MNILTALYFLSAFFQDSEVPYKPSNEFEIQIDYQFKQRPFADPNTIDYTAKKDADKRKLIGTGLRPYLILTLNLVTLSDQEVKVRAINNLGRPLFNKKAKVGDFTKIDMGFTDDVKDRIGAYEITILLSSPQRKETSRIHLFVQPDGTFVVNGEVRGKF
jgi:hypothetical protein